MYRIDNATSAPILPDAGAPGVNPNSYFTKGSPSLATPATIVDDIWLNSMQEEFCSLVELSGQTLVKGDYTQLKKAVDYLHQKNGAIYAASASAPNAYTATLSPVPAAYTEGMGALIKFTSANTNAATINLNTLGAKSLKKFDGTALVAGDISDGMIGFIVYDGVSFQLINSAVNPISIYTTSTSSPNTYTATLDFPPISYFAGMHILVKFSNANTTGGATINFNGIGAGSIKRQDSTALLPNDIVPGMVGHLVYDGTNFQLMNANRQIKSIKKRYITSSTTYTPSAGMVEIEIEMVGAGAGSTGCVSTSTLYGMGTAGGSGGYLKKKFTAEEVGATAAIVIGAGGVGGNTAGTGGDGGTGGSTTFTPTGTGATLTCGGGLGGTTVQKAAGGISNGGTGGAATNGDFNIPGQIGGGSMLSAGIGSPQISVGTLGTGASTPLGLGGPLLTAENSLAGFSGTGYGSSASAGWSVKLQTSVAGTAGQPGIVIITEYCSQ